MPPTCIEGLAFSVPVGLTMSLNIVVIVAFQPAEPYPVYPCPVGDLTGTGGAERGSVSVLV